VFAGMPEGGQIFRVACLVVLLSIALHGGTLIWIGRRGGPVPRAPELIDIDELRELVAQGATVRPIDVRREEVWAESDEQARGAVRVSPERPVPDVRALDLPPDAWLVAYCTCPSEGTSGRVLATGARADRRLRRVEGGGSRRGAEGLTRLRSRRAARTLRQ